MALHILVPEDLARALIDEGFARRASKPRGTIIEWAVSGAAEVSVWVTILQTPAMIQFYATWLRAHAAKKKQRVAVRVSGPRGTLELFDVRPEDDLSDIIGEIQGLLGE